MASGKAKYIAGLRDLVGGFTLMEQRRHQRMLENLEKAKFEYEKQLRDAQLAEEEAYHQGVIGVRKSELSAKTQKAAEDRRAAFSEQIQRGRVSKNLESGNLPRAARIAFNRGLATYGQAEDAFKPAEPTKLTGIAAEAEAAGMSPLDYRKAIAAVSRVPERTGEDVYRETEELAAKMGGIPAIPYNMGKASRFVRGADNLPLPEIQAQEEDDEMTAEEIVQRGYEKELLEAKNTVVELIRLAGVPNGRLNAEGQRVVKLLATAEGQLAKEQVLRDFLGVNPKKPGRFNESKVLRLLEGY